MKNLFGLLFIILFSVSAKSQMYDFTINNQTREYYLHMPNSLTDNAPLVFVLHGYSGSASSIKHYSGMDQIADDHGFAVCYPQGLTDQWDNSFWSVGYSFHENLNVDDVGFLTALAQYLQNEYTLSSEKTFCTGMSNGGDMCYLLACQASDVFSAVAPVAGCMMEWIYRSCSPLSPIPVFEIHGTNDEITYWDGDMDDNQGYGPYLDVPTTIDFWVQLNNCTQYESAVLPDIYPTDGSIVISEKHTDGINHNEVWLYKIVNGGHDWPGSSGNKDIQASEEIWDFFVQVMDNASSIKEDCEYQILSKFELYQNYPNPFNPVTMIKYDLREEAFVKLTVCDILGREIVTLINTTQKPGINLLKWDARDAQNNKVGAGVYLYRIQVDQSRQTGKMILLQ